MPAMRRPVTVLVALAWATVPSGCPDWSRPDPALKRVVEPAPVRPAAPETTTAMTVAPQPVDIGALRDGVRRLRESPAQPGALAELERLESMGFDLLEGGPAEEQAEAEALLQELSDLRAELVDDRRDR